MSDLISRKAAIELIENESREYGEDYGISDVLCDLSDLPSAQPERKKGQWNWIGFNIECPFCGYMPMFDSTEPLYNFCPNCGADLRPKS